MRKSRMFPAGVLMYVLLICTFVLVFYGSAGALQLQVGSVDAHPGDDISVQITVGEYAQEQIAAASFTLTYDHDQLALTGIESDFFVTFTGQWNSLNPLPSPVPPSSVIVNGHEYSQPVMSNTLSEGSAGMTLISGARVNAGAPTILFVLHFSVNPAAAPDIYPISISPTALDNADAGYPPGGPLLPVPDDALDGENDLTAAYPGYLPDLVSGSVNVQMPFIDTDHDGIYDQWELDNFGDLTTADATSDYDQDGYTDLQEYLNAFYPVETDPDGQVYDPVNIHNAPGGTGYNPVNKSGFWLMMLPAILNGGQQ